MTPRGMVRSSPSTAVVPSRYRLVSSYTVMIGSVTAPPAACVLVREHSHKYTSKSTSRRVVNVADVRSEPVRRLPRAQRREQILAAATRAFARNGFTATGLDDIAT